MRGNTGWKLGLGCRCQVPGTSALRSWNWKRRERRGRKREGIWRATCCSVPLVVGWHATWWTAPGPPVWRCSPYIIVGLSSLLYHKLIRFINSELINFGKCYIQCADWESNLSVCQETQIPSRCLSVAKMVESNCNIFWWKLQIVPGDGAPIMTLGIMNLLQLQSKYLYLMVFFKPK